MKATKFSIYLIVLNLIFFSCVPVDEQEMKVQYSKSQERRRDKAEPVIKSIYFSKNNAFLNFEGKNFRGVTSIVVKENFIAHGSTGLNDKVTIKKFLNTILLKKRKIEQDEKQKCYQNRVNEGNSFRKEVLFKCLCPYRKGEKRKSFSQCENTHKERNGNFSEFAITEGNKLTVNFENYYSSNMKNIDSQGSLKWMTIIKRSLKFMVGRTYDFIITNSYGQTSFSIIIDFKDGSITTEKIADQAVTNEKIADGAITTDKLKIEGVKNGQFLAFDGEKNVWAPKTFEGMEYRGAWNIKGDSNQEFGPTGEGDVSPRGHYYIVSTPGITRSSHLEVMNCGDGGDCEWYTGDWIVSDGEKWQRVTNSGKVTGFKGTKDTNPRIGVIEAQTGDYTWNQINKAVSKVSEIADVSVTPAKKGQILQWDAKEGQWTPQTLQIESNDIVDNTITSEDIADGAITNEKLAEGSVKSDQIVSGAVTTEKLKESSVTTEKIADDAVTTGKMADVSVTSGKLANSSITTEKIANGAVTSPKLAAGSVIGSKIPASAISTLKLADSAVTTEKIKDGAITREKIADGSITTAKYAEGSVTSEKIPDNSITEEKLANSAVTTEKIVDGAINNSKIANGAVTTEKIAGDAVTSDKLPNDVITTSKLASEAVTTEKIADGNVTTAKIADGAVTSSKFAAGSITTVKIPDNGITTKKLANSSVTAEKIKDGEIVSSKILNGAVTSAKLAPNSVTSDKIPDGAIVDSDISSNASLSRNKIEAGTKGHIVTNDGSGKLTSKAVLSISEGGTGATTASQARINLGVKIGADVQAYSSRLDDISSMNPSAKNFVGVNGQKLELKTAESVRQEMDLGIKSQLFVRSTDGNVGIGTTSPAAKLDVNGNAKVRGQLDMSSQKVTNVANPTAGTDGVNLAWVNTQISNLSIPFYYIYRTSISSFGNGDVINWGSGGTEVSKSSNYSSIVERSGSSFKIKNIGFYQVKFQGLFKNSSNTSQLHEINIDIKEGSGSWKTLSKPKTFGNTMFVGDIVFKVSSTVNPVSIRMKNKSGHTVSLETLQVTMSRIGDL